MSSGVARVWNEGLFLFTRGTEHLKQRNTNGCADLPVMFARGAVCDHSSKVVHLNNGHLGDLDCPEQALNVNGVQRMHSEKKNDIRGA